MAVARASGAERGRAVDGTDVLLLCLLGGLAVAALLPLLVVPELLIVVFVAIGLGRGCGVVANTLSTVRLSERGVLARGSASALINTGQDLASLLGPTIATTTAALLGIDRALQVVPLAGLLLGLGAMLAARRLHGGRDT